MKKPRSSLAIFSALRHASNTVYNSGEASSVASPHRSLHYNAAYAILKACLSPQSSPLLRSSYILIALLTLCACTSRAVVSTPVPLPTVLSFIPLSELHGNAEQNIRTLAYALPEQQGLSLHDSVSFSQPQAVSLTPPELRIWCDMSCTAQLPTSTATIVLAQGRLIGPGAYGPQGLYRWQLKQASLTVPTAEESTLAALMQRVQSFDMRLLHVSGTILLSKDSALLVDQLDPSGIPAATAHQVKLRWLHSDEQLIQSLKLMPGSDIRSGPVQVEGYMLNGRLVPLTIKLRS